MSLPIIWAPGDTRVTHRDGAKCPHKLTSRQVYFLERLHEECSLAAEIREILLGDDEAQRRLFPPADDPVFCIYCRAGEDG